METIKQLIYFSIAALLLTIVAWFILFIASMLVNLMGVWLGFIMWFGIFIYMTYDYVTFILKE